MATGRRVRIGLQDDNGRVTGDFVELNASLNETHSSVLNITSNPIERGSEITDHAYSAPRELTIRGHINSTYKDSFVSALSPLPTSVTGKPQLTDVEGWDKLKEYQLNPNLI